MQFELMSVSARVYYSWGGYFVLLTLVCRDQCGSEASPVTLPPTHTPKCVWRGCISKSERGAPWRDARGVQNLWLHPHPQQNSGHCLEPGRPDQQQTTGRGNQDERKELTLTKDTDEEPIQNVDFL